MVETFPISVLHFSTRLKHKYDFFKLCVGNNTNKSTIYIFKNIFNIIKNTVNKVKIKIMVVIFT